MTTISPHAAQPAARVDARHAAQSTPAEARQRFRDGLVAPTTGWAAGFTQANMVMLPQDWAFDMLLFGQRNPQPVPLLDVTDPGATSSPLDTERRPAHRPAPLPRLARRRARRRAHQRHRPVAGRPGYLPDRVQLQL